MVKHAGLIPVDIPEGLFKLAALLIRFMSLFQVLTAISQSPTWNMQLLVTGTSLFVSRQQKAF